MCSSRTTPAPDSTGLGYLKASREYERTIEIQTALRREQLEAPALVADAMGASVAALVAVIADCRTRSAGSRPNWPTVLSNTRTPRSSAPCQDSR
jgi:hypothetical protein